MNLSDNFPNAQSYLLTGADENNRLKAIETIYSRIFGSTSKHPDFLLLEEDLRLGINQIRKLQQVLALKPFSAEVKLAVIKNAQNMTTEAQNALLKTLEEPNPTSIIILETATPQNLLPTIISRCQTILLKIEKQNSFENLDQKEEIEILSELKSLLKTPLSKRLTWSEENSKDIKNLLLKTRVWLTFWRNILLKKVNSSKEKALFNLETFQIKIIVEDILKAQNFLEKKLNSRLVLDWLMIKLPYIN